MRRGIPAVEYILNNNLPYLSGPQWLAEYVLKERWVIAVAGTHGKTTTSSILAWILTYAGLKPGFLIGGVANNFAVTARLGESPFFVVEADEYDTAFFDKRSKFVHYQPRTLIINNIEFDHADIFPDLTAIQKQFHHLVRIVPSEGRLITPYEQPTIEQTLAMGCWTERQTTGISQGDIQALPELRQQNRFELKFNGQTQAQVTWDLFGEHNISNALNAIAAARHVGVDFSHGCAALAEFQGVKRRMELRGEVNGIRIYDDFAHHPTAISATLSSWRAMIGHKRLIAVLELRSNTMKMGIHNQVLANALSKADKSFILKPDNVTVGLINQIDSSVAVYQQIDLLIEQLCQYAEPEDDIVVMSNGSFGDIHNRLLTTLAV